MARGSRHAGRSGVKALTASYAALEAEIERQVDERFGDGRYRSVVSRLTAWHAADWFSAALHGGAEGALPDPMEREERLVDIVAGWVDTPAVAVMQGTGAVVSSLGIAHVITPPGPLRSLACSLYGLEVVGSTVADLGTPSSYRSIVCIDVLQAAASRGGVQDFLVKVAGTLGSSASLVIADNISFQDDAVENLVALDFEFE